MMSEFGALDPDLLRRSHQEEASMIAKRTPRDLHTLGVWPLDISLGLVLLRAVHRLQNFLLLTAQNLGGSKR